ncbi:MAG: electron transfer flavoprotein subunit beta/FixA family protein [Anaerolineae bacterium]|jgi:electron transfer flavoprotein beta subunit|nr:electron transfer flavoprotein subunit beta/FixA family protein [Anaerolineae bacterium]
MDVVVCMKQVPDLQQIRIKERKPVLENVPLVWGDLDKNAMEEAVKVKEKLGDAKITVVALGSDKLQQGILEPLAMGADEAVLLTDPAFAGSDSMGTAKVLAKAIQKLGSYDLIVLGEGSTDNYSGVVASALAELLNLPEITYVRELEVQDGKVKAVRNMEESFEVMEAALPALVTVVQEINEPRLPKFMAIRKAGSKPRHEWSPSDLGLSPAEVGRNALSVETISNLAPEQDRKNVILKGDLSEQIDGLVDALIREGVLGR